MSKHQIPEIGEDEALEYLDDMLTWWRRRGRPDMRAKARRAQQIVGRLRLERTATNQRQQEVA